MTEELTEMEKVWAEFRQYFQDLIKEVDAEEKEKVTSYQIKLTNFL